MSLLPLIILAAAMTLAYYGFKDMFLVLNRHYHKQQPSTVIAKEISLNTTSNYNASYVAAE